MKTAEAFLKKNDVAIDRWPDTKALIIKAINEARIEAIEECAANATLESRVFDGRICKIREDMGQEINTSERNRYIGVSEQSILKLIGQVK